MKRRLLLLLLVVGVWSLGGCTQGEVSLIDTEWTYSNPNVDGAGVVELIFHPQSLCTVRHIALHSGEAVVTQEMIGYRYTTPKVVLVLPTGEQVVGVFYDNYTRLELGWGSAEMTFYKSR